MMDTYDNSVVNDNESIFIVRSKQHEEKSIVSRKHAGSGFAYWVLAMQRTILHVWRSIEFCASSQVVGGRELTCRVLLKQLADHLGESSVSAFSDCAVIAAGCDQGCVPLCLLALTEQHRN